MKRENQFILTLGTEEQFHESLFCSYSGRVLFFVTNANVHWVSERGPYTFSQQLNNSCARVNITPNNSRQSTTHYKLNYSVVRKYSGCFLPKFAIL